MSNEHLQFGSSSQILRLEFPTNWDVEAIYAGTSGVTIEITSDDGTVLLAEDDADLGQDTTLDADAVAGSRQITLSSGATDMVSGDRLRIMASEDGGAEDVEVDWYDSTGKICYLKRDLYRSHADGAEVYGLFATYDLDLSGAAWTQGLRVLIRWNASIVPEVTP